MRVIIGLALLGMAIPQMGNLGLPGYLPVIGCLVAIFIINKKVYTSDSLWYNIGGGLCLVGMAVGSFINGNSVSIAYVGFGVLLFCFYPVFKHRGIERYVLKIVFWILAISVIPIGSSGTSVGFIYENPNNYSGIVLCTMYFGLLIYEDSWWRQLAIYAAALGLVLMGGSRSIFGAILVFGAIYFVQRYLTKTHFRLLLVTAFAIMCVAYYTLITDDRFKLLETVQQTTVNENKKERGLSHRDALFYLSLEISKDFPEGVGMGRSNIVIGERYPYAYTPHNTFLKALVEGGWIMFIGLMILIVGFLGTNTSYLASSFLFVLLIRGLFESSTPFSISLISSMWVIPMFLDELSIRKLPDIVIVLPERSVKELES